MSQKKRVAASRSSVCFLVRGRLAGELVVAGGNSDASDTAFASRHEGARPHPHRTLRCRLGVREGIDLRGHAMLKTEQFVLSVQS
jgi:hypothetical protein